MMNQVLIAGDSWAELAGAHLEALCPNTGVEHFSEGGKTAAEMVSDVANLDSVLGEDYKPDHIWLSIGGNDVVEAPNCEPDFEQIFFDITFIVKSFTNRYPDSTILLTGYGIASDLSFSECNIAESYEQSEFLLQTLQGVSPRVRVVPVSELFGGTFENGALIESDSQYFDDEIHLNKEGYERLFTYPPVSAALGCQPEYSSSPAPTPSASPKSTLPIPPPSSPTIGSQALNNGASGAVAAGNPLWSLVCVVVAVMKFST